MLKQPRFFTYTSNADGRAGNDETLAAKPCRGGLTFANRADNLGVMTATPKQLAARYGCSERTIYRWKAHGVDVLDARAVADFVYQNPGQNPATIAAIIEASRNAPQPTAGKLRRNPLIN